MEKLLLDTNVLIHVIRSAQARHDLAAFQRLRAPVLWQHAVVAAEILAGAPDTATYDRWRRAWIEPAERIGRLIEPVYATWVSAARIIVQLYERRHITTRSVPAGFMNDCLIAADASEHGCTVVTHNVKDFELIGRVVPGLRYLRPFP